MNMKKKKKRKSKKWIIIIVVVVLLLAISAAAYFIFNSRGKTDIAVDSSVPRINVTSPAFINLGVIPKKYTGHGEDISPALDLAELDENAVSIAIIMDDLDVPWAANFTHWVIWNIPAITHIPEGIAPGKTVPDLEDAVQGVAYGTNRYRGPKPPFGTHRYLFHIFVLDAKMNLDSSCSKIDLLNAMQGYVLQYGTLTGWFPRED